MPALHIHEDGNVMDKTKLMAHIVNDHDDVPADDLYAAIRKGDTEVRALHDLQHPETRPEKVTFRYYLHDDERESLYDYLIDPPTGRFSNGDPAIRPDIAREIADATPFYEVAVTVEYDTTTKKFNLIEAKL